MVGGVDDMLRPLLAVKEIHVAEGAITLRAVEIKHVRAAMLTNVNLSVLFKFG